MTVKVDRCLFDVFVFKQVPCGHYGGMIGGVTVRRGDFITVLDHAACCKDQAVEGLVWYPGVRRVQMGEILQDVEISADLRVEMGI